MKPNCDDKVWGVKFRSHQSYENGGRWYWFAHGMREGDAVYLCQILGKDNDFFEWGIA